MPFLPSLASLDDVWQLASTLGVVAVSLARVEMLVSFIYLQAYLEVLKQRGVEADSMHNEARLLLVGLEFISVSISDRAQADQLLAPPMVRREKEPNSAGHSQAVLVSLRGPFQSFVGGQAFVSNRARQFVRTCTHNFLY